MNKIISVTNPKGGSCKTTTAVNIAAGLAMNKRKVLFIDNDPQANATINLLPEDVKVTETIKSIYKGLSVPNATYQSTVHGLDIIPSNMSLSTLEFDLAGRSDRNILLRKAVNSRTVSDYDYVIIDTPPSLGLLVSNPLVAADGLIIPVHGYYSLEGIAEYNNVISRFTSENKNLKIDSIVMTMVENTVLARDIRNAITDIFGDKVCKTDIPKSVKFDEAPSYKQSIYDYAPGSSASVQHMKLVEELLEKWETT